MTLELLKGCSAWMWKRCQFLCKHSKCCAAHACVHSKFCFLHWVHRCHKTS